MASRKRWPAGTPGKGEPENQEPGMKTVTSKDGTTIAYDQTGHGPPLVLVDGALNSRTFGLNGPLAAILADRFTVVTYDRRGRGDSGDTPPYAAQREIEDLEAVIDANRGPAYVYGISSGAGLALETACAVPAKVARLALYEPSFVVDDTRPPVPADAVAQVTDLLARNRRGAAVKLFLREDAQVPPVFVALMPLMPAWGKLKALAHTLPYDLTIMAFGQQGRPLPADRWASLTAPTLVMAGGKSPGWLQNAARAVAQALPRASHRTLPGQTHIIKAKALAPVLAEFFTHTPGIRPAGARDTT
jgi:pimeloyl-ACP methyl ester carboxylesterase